MALQKPKLTVLGQQESEFNSPYLSSPKIDVPNTAITDLQGNVRQINDPSKTIRLAMGPERVHFRNIKQFKDEKGANGEQVFGLQEDDRVRFVGNWSRITSTTGNSFQWGTETTNYFEVSFYGTGLNLVAHLNNVARDWRVSVDGGSEGANVFLQGQDIISARNLEVNQVINISTGLALGNHTVKIRNNTAVTGQFFGVEILNSFTSIQVPKGEIVSAGKKEVISVASTSAFNSGFDGSPSLNGRGGHVLVYMKDGTLGKVIQQTESSPAYLGSASHANEEVIKKINFREFGANRSDDFSTEAAGLDNNAFVLQDGTHNLVGSNANVASGSNGVWPGTTGAAITLTFVGTGIDILRTDTTGTIDSHDFYINGSVVGNITGGTGNNLERIQKIASGLPFGAHTLKIIRVSAVSAAIGASEFIIYGPKKPTIPSGATQIGEYYLMADFVANTVAGIETIATGVVRKYATREMFYNAGAWGININVLTYVGGFALGTNTPTNYFEYTFMGTGFEHRASTNTAGSGQVDILLNGVALTTANYGTAVFSTYGGFSFNSGTGALDANNSTTNGSGFRVSGLPYGLYKVRMTMTGAGTPGMSVEAFDVITPICYPNIRTGSLTMAPSIPFATNDEAGNIDFSKAKAWIIYDGTNQQVFNSYNIASVLKATTGHYMVTFDKPFKTNKYTASYGGYLSQMFVSDLSTGANASNVLGMKAGTFTFSTANTAGSVGDSPLITLAFFGEQVDEE